MRRQWGADCNGQRLLRFTLPRHQVRSYPQAKGGWYAGIDQRGGAGFGPRGGPGDSGPGADRSHLQPQCPAGRSGPHKPSRAGDGRTVAHPPATALGHWSDCAAFQVRHGPASTTSSRRDLSKTGRNASMDKADIPFLSVSQLSELIKHRQVSPVEVVEGYLERIDRLNDRLYAYVTVCHDQAVEAAQAAERE